MSNMNGIVYLCKNRLAVNSNKLNKMISPHLQNGHEPQETSTKKYPYNKYYKFQDQESSGRKYIQDTFNMWDNPSQEKQGHQSLFNLQRDYQKYCHTKKNKESCKKIKMKKTLNNTKEKLKKKQCNKSVLHSVNSVRNSSKRKKTDEKHGNGDTVEELKHYKKLCLDMRKKNTQLTRELSECKQNNKKSLCELQSKVNKLSEKYLDKNQSADPHKVDKIFQSLKHINGKLSKKAKNKPENAESHKFYNFFVESLDILRQNSNGSDAFRNKMSVMEAQTTWKQILQFLISHDYRLQNYSAKTIR